MVRLARIGLGLEPFEVRRDRRRPGSFACAPQGDKGAFAE